MAKGYPDFFGFSMFPWYGGIIRSAFATTCPADTVTPIHAIVSKGSIVGGYLQLTGVADITDILIYAWVDGQLITTLRYGGTLVTTTPGVPTDWFYLDVVSYERELMCAHIQPGISFQDTWTISVDNRSLADSCVGNSIVFYQRVAT